MSAYELYLLLHIGAAIAWVGAGLLMVMLGTRATRARDGERVVAYARDAEWLGLRLFLPANLLALASGFLLVEKGNWGYDPSWIKLGLAGFAVSFLIGALFFAPGWGRVDKLATGEGADSPAVHAAVRRLQFGSRVDLGLLVAVVFVMTVKPTAAEPGTLAVAAAIPAAFALLALVLFRTEARRAPGAHTAAAVR
jgi:uncharacterized membrane protein